MRASDQERQHVVDQLHYALGEGRLELAETDDRVAAAYAARYRSDLSPLLADLPEASAVGSLGATVAVTAMGAPNPTARRRRLVTRPVAVMVAAVLGLGMLGGVAGGAGIALGETGAAAQHQEPGRGHDVHGIGFRSRH